MEELMSSYKKSVLGVLGAAAFMLAAGPAMADYPDKPIQVIVPYSAGGDSDLTARIWADAVEKEIGSPIVVVNRPGGSGVVGTAFVANAKKDGYTLVNAGLGNVQVVPNFSQTRSEEHTSELQSRGHLVCRLLLEKKKT